MHPPLQALVIMGVAGCGKRDLRQAEHLAVRDIGHVG
ncbi:hypothetical protein ACLBUZ_31340, partial [Pseudomonas aeruginosa]